MINIRSFLKISKILMGIAFLYGTATSCSIRKNSEFSLLNPYEHPKKYAYKASLHNHSSYHPEYTHAVDPPWKRLVDYRDYETNPPYGIVAISDHNRLTIPENSSSSGSIYEDNNAPWGVENILWIPANESKIGDQQKGGIHGDFLIVNASTVQTSDIDWLIVEDPLSQNGQIYYSKEMPAAIEFTFSGTEVHYIACKEPEGGIASVYLDHQKIGEIDFYSERIQHQQTLLHLDGLTEKKHVLKIVYDRKGKSVSQYMGRINIDLVVVSTKNQTKEEYGAAHSCFQYQPFKYKHVAHPIGKGHEVEVPLRMLSEDGCFLVLPHPNARLETSGKHKGTQLWTSSGYTYKELDLIFGNAEEGINPGAHLPHALEIGNRGYDFSARTNYKNAEEKWDYLLKQGHRIWGTASDDTHGSVPFEGWIVVYTNAPSRDKLTLEDVMESLFTGNYYSSQGPNMEIRVNKRQFTVNTDNPSKIEFIAGGKVVSQATDVLSAAYKIKGDEGYVRAKVTQKDVRWRDIEGGIGRQRSAWSNPIYILPLNDK